MSYDARSQTLRCPYCGSTNLEESKDQRFPNPSKIVLFRIGQPNAQQLLSSWLGRGFWRPGDLSTKSTVDKMAAVYVPFWVFSAKTHTYWTADSGKTPFGAKANWYPVSGENRNRYRGLLVGASSVLTPDESRKIGPFDLSKAELVDEHDLTDSNVEQFTVARKYARPLARIGLEEQERQACAQRYLSSHRNLKVNVRLEEMRSVPYLLPVWVMAYRYQGKLYRILINGQSGRVVGSAPFSWAKLIVLILVLLLAFVAFALVSAQ